MFGTGPGPFKPRLECSARLPQTIAILKLNSRAPVRSTRMASISLFVLAAKKPMVARTRPETHSYLPLLEPHALLTLALN